jgi:signal transduction histidine kinase
MSRRLLALLLALSAGAPAAQPLPSLDEGASIRSQRWTWRDYDAHPQNWGVAQAPSGLVYVANSEGLLEYDGEEWRLHSLPVQEQAVVRSLAVSSGGDVYVGGAGDFGVFSSSGGGLEYRSLRGYAEPAERGFQDVWTTHITPQGVVFQTARRLFRWDGAEMRSWSTPSRFRSAFLVREVLYVWEEGAGIKRLGTDRLELVPGGGWFADRKTDALLPHPQGLLAVVRGEGLVLLAGGQARPLEGAGSDYLRRHRPYTAVALPDRYGAHGWLYAVATFGGGVALVAPDGQLVRAYGADVGLHEEDQAVGLVADEQGGLWVALLNGVARIDLFSRLTVFDEGSGLLGSVYTVAEAEAEVWAGTSTGLYRLVPGRLGRPGEAGPAYARFARAGVVPGGQTWALLPTSAGLLIGTNSGVYVIRGGQGRRVSEARGFEFLQLSQRSDRVLVGSKGGVLTLSLRDGRWSEDEWLDGVEGEVRSLVEDASGAVWLSQVGGGVFRVTGAGTDTPAVQKAEGLGVSGGPLLVVGEEVYMTPREGVFALGYQGGEVQARRAPGLDDLQGVFGLFPGADGRVWTSRDGVFRPLGGGAFRAPSASFELRGVQVISFARTPDGVAWVGTADGLLRYDPRVNEGAPRYPAFVRRVTDGQREALWGGAAASGAGGPALTLDYADKSELRFEAAAALFDAPSATEYQFRLDGFNDTWGAWGPERVATYTNLWEGDYTLRVRARDAYGRLSEKATFAFVVSPPWYRTWWAYGLYVLAGLAVVWGVSAWRLHEHRKRLDAQRARSARLQRLSRRLERLTVRLRAADKLKDDLLANTSHELRTPLTAILGFSEMLLDDVSDDLRDLVEGVQRGGQRLLSTVNGLLDMYKLQSGTLTVTPAAVDAAACVRESVGQLRPIAQGRGLDLDVLPDGLALPATLDAGLLDRIVTNLVSNALKFTDRGRVLVLLDGDDDTVRVAVRDTGIGIAAGDVDRVFEPFEQASTGYGRSHEGTGLGLAIVKRIVDEVGGYLDVESEPGVGTTVTVTVPRHWGADAPEGPPAAPAEPALEGAHLLGIGLDRATEALLRQWVDGEGVVTAVNSLGRGLREARRGSYDVLFVAADEPRAEAKRVRALRNVPGYREAPAVRVGGAPLGPGELRARGFTHQVGAPVGHEVVDLVRDLLGRVEAAAVA